MSDEKLKIYKLTVDGWVNYWEAARAEWDCERLIEECEGDGFASETEISVAELTAEQCAATRIRCDDTGEKLTMDVILSEQKKPAVIGCSEW
jgi:hypothetical protein